MNLILKRIVYIIHGCQGKVFMYSSYERIFNPTLKYSPLLPIVYPQETRSQVFPECGDVPARWRVRWCRGGGWSKAEGREVENGRSDGRGEQGSVSVRVGLVVVR